MNAYHQVPTAATLNKQIARAFYQAKHCIKHNHYLKQLLAVRVKQKHPSIVLPPGHEVETLHTFLHGYVDCCLATIEMMLSVIELAGRDYLTMQDRIIINITKYFLPTNKKEKIPKNIIDFICAAYFINRLLEELDTLPIIEVIISDMQYDVIKANLIVNFLLGDKISTVLDEKSMSEADIIRRAYPAIKNKLWIRWYDKPCLLGKCGIDLLIDRT
jgi:hypothetical protein